MTGYYIFIFILILILILAEVTAKRGFQDLALKREAAASSILEGESFKMSMIIENNKLLPISFMLITEKLPMELVVFEEENLVNSGESNYHITKLNIRGHERVRRTYSIRASKRGTYLLREVKMAIGDAFGLNTRERDFEDYVELLVYPKVIDLKQLEFNTTSFQGDSIIKRWIYKDPLYIKGIREYNIEDRMKDVHWKSSLKMMRLMVKDYDYTAEMELMIILSVECGEPYYSSIDDKAIERGIALAAALSRQSIKEGVSVGFWCNSQLISYGEEVVNEIAPSLNSLKHIMELCARIDYTPRLSFNECLIEKSKRFNKNTTYIVVADFLNEESIAIISRLARSGFIIKLIDISSKSKLPSIKGIEKAIFKNFT